MAAAAAALCLTVVGPVLAQATDDPLPAAPGKDVVVRVCTACHEAAQFAYARHTPDEWDNEIAKMQSAGAEMTAEEQAAISAYLAKNLAPPAPAPPSDAKPPSGGQSLQAATVSRTFAGAGLLNSRVPVLELGILQAHQVQGIVLV